MEMTRPRALAGPVLAGWSVSVLLVSKVDGGGLVERRLAALGARVTVQAELAAALARLLENRAEARVDLLVIDCDQPGGETRDGMTAGHQAFDSLAMAGLRLPVMLICSACPEQIFPVSGEGPFRLRAPLSAMALRIGFELAFGALPADAVIEAGGPEKGRSRGGAPFRI